MQPPLQRLKSIDQWQAVAGQIRAMPGVRVVAPVVSGSALAVRGSASRAVSILGMDPPDYYRIVDVPGKLVRGRGDVGSADILIGIDLASDLGLDLGDKLRLTTAAGGAVVPERAGHLRPREQRRQPAHHLALHTAQSLLGLPGGVTSLDVTLDDVYAAERMAQRITAATGVQADSWIKTSAQFFAAISAQSTANTAIRLFVGCRWPSALPACWWCRWCRSHARLASCARWGAPGQILRLFLLQGGLLGLAGSMAGSAAGAAGLWLWQQLERNPMARRSSCWRRSQSLCRRAAAGQPQRPAGVLPRRCAARLDPVVAIRG